MTQVDVIILSCARDSKLKGTTESAIRSLHRSEPKRRIRFNVVVIESNANLFPYQYPDSSTIYPKCKFGFNKFVNIGLRQTTSDYVCIANNDLFFHPNWATALMNAMRSDPDLVSASPYCTLFHPNVNLKSDSGLYYGYDIRMYVTGWCLFIRRSVFNVIGPLDENLYFWFCDNDYANLLKRHNLKHALVTSSLVDHLDGMTTETLDSPEKYNLTRGAFLYYDYKWNHNRRLLYYCRLLKHHFRLLKLKYPAWN